MSETLALNAQNPEPEKVRQVSLRLQRGEVVAMPTDTVYGLAANPFHLAAVERIYALKGRAHTKPLPLLVPGIAAAEELARGLPPIFHALAEAFWPGPLTLIVQAASPVPLKVTAHTGHVALRFPLAPIAVAIMLELGHPLTGTSANLSGMPECASAQEVELQMGMALPLIVDGGAARSRQPSTLVDLTGEVPRLLREGVIPREALQKFLAL